MKTRILGYDPGLATIGYGILDVEDKKITVIQQQTNVIQNGDHNVNLTNNGTINFHF